MNSLLYNGVDYSIPQFVEEFSTEFPVIAIVTSGSSGCGYEISADEVYWIHGFQRQKRLVVKELSDTKGTQSAVKFLSIPIDYPTRFHLITDTRGKKCTPAMPLAKLQEETKCSPAPHRIMFENNTQISFTIGGQKNMTASFGVMEIVDVYNQKYLAGYSITDNSIYPNNSAIPVFMDITLDVASGIQGRSVATYRQWMNDISKVVASSFHTRDAAMYDEIVQFNEIPDGGHYEYMRPKKFFIMTEESKAKYSYTALERRHSSTNGQSAAASIYTATPGDCLPQIPKRSTLPTRPPPSLLPRQGSTSKREPRQQRLPPVRPQSPLMFREFKHVSEVPKDLDVESLTVEDVDHCLSLLGMYRHAVTLRERNVDGAMLNRLDIQTLIDDFNFTEFDATQLNKFLRGWRP